MGAIIDQFGRDERGDMGEVEQSGLVQQGAILQFVQCAKTGSCQVSNIPFATIQTRVRDAHLPLTLGFAAVPQQQQTRRSRPIVLGTPGTTTLPSTPAPAPTPPSRNSALLQRLQQRQQDMRMLRIFFDEIDADSSGTVDHEELGGLLQVLGLPEDDDVLATFEQQGEDLTFTKFVSLVEALKKRGFDLGRLLLNHAGGASDDPQQSQPQSQSSHSPAQIVSATPVPRAQAFV